jgi:hypothetical protein
MGNRQVQGGAGHPGKGQEVPVPGRRGRHIVANMAHTLSRRQGEGVHTVAHSRLEEGVVLCSL